MYIKKGIFTPGRGPGRHIFTAINILCNNGVQPIGGHYSGGPPIRDQFDDFIQSQHEFTGKTYRPGYKRAVISELNHLKYEFREANNHRRCR